MSQAKIGAQMYTLRDFCKNPQEIAQACARVKKMGYDGIQPSAAGFNDIDANELKKICDNEGLACAATHKGLLGMDDDQVKQTIEYHQIIDCKYTAIGGFHPREQWTVEVWEDFVKQYNELAKKFAEGGIRIGYHNHSHELSPLPNGNTPLQMLIDQLDQSIWFEIDVYWIAHGLGDPADWLGKAGGRAPCIHYKDGIVSRDRQHKMCEVGSGNLNWPAINAASSSAGVEWYLVERDSGDLDPFESLEISVRQMREMGL